MAQRSKTVGPTFTRKGMTPELARELIATHGTASQAARSILSRCLDYANRPASFHAVRQWIQDASRDENGKGSKQIYDPDDTDFVNQVANVIKESNIPI